MNGQSPGKQVVQRRPKHVPRRTCVVCRQQGAKRQLTRIVRQPDGEVRVDSTGKMNGRGAYLCDARECWQRAADGHSLSRALRTELDPETRERLHSVAAERTAGSIQE